MKDSNKFSFPLWLMMPSIILAMVIGWWLGFRFFMKTAPQPVAKEIVTYKTVAKADITTEDHLFRCTEDPEDYYISSCVKDHGTVDIDGHKFYKVMNGDKLYLSPAEGDSERYQKLFYMVRIKDNGEIE